MAGPRRGTLGRDSPAERRFDAAVVGIGNGHAVVTVVTGEG
ncbi:hypothetical protein [Streptomyces sp. NRRL S-1448]|nr:hypothetical protein [Streptomyces sp. NRRL S-1448]